MAIDGEGDAGLAEDVLRILGLADQMRGILAGVPVVIGAVRRSRKVVR